MYSWSGVSIPEEGGEREVCQWRMGDEKAIPQVLYLSYTVSFPPRSSERSPSGKSHDMERHDDSKERTRARRVSGWPTPPLT